MQVINAWLRSPTWTPLSLSSVVAWFDASQLSGLSDADPVSSWTDVVGGNHAIQGTGTKQPSYRTNVLNGRPVLRFGGDDGLATTSTVDLSATNDITVWAVVSADATANVHIFAEQSDNYNIYNDAWILSRVASQNASTATRESSNYSQALSTATLTTTHKIIVATIDKGLSTNEATMSVNGDGSFTRPLNSNLGGNFGNRRIYIGSRNTSSLYLTGDIAEMGICSAALGASDIDALESYLGAKYGITVA